MSEVIISAKDVKALRDQTGAGMMDCKAALAEAEGDFEKAIEILRKKGQKLSLKRADRDAKEGVVIAKVNQNGTRGVVVRLSCETDFVAKNEDFVSMTERIADIALNTWSFDKDALVTQDIGGITIADKITEQVGVIGEKIELADYEKIEAPLVCSYIHMGNKAGVIVGLTLSGEQFTEAGRDVAMQIAAMKPVAVNKDGVSQTVIDKEIEIGKEIARQEGKPEAMLEKIALGKLNKFFKESTLLEQSFVKDSKQSVDQYLRGINKELTVTEFRHIMLG
ncbi:MAG TPA: translation elongation factor Ts [Saprospiraceae bacterium]|mgnify:FL=1|nr:translation elongation factor Ts [Saprospiraceae bacterium]